MPVKISIVTATYNCASTIEDCLRSVAGQQHDEIEHVVIDGASSDQTLPLLRQHAGQIDCLVSEADGGIYDALNKGVALTTGEVVGFLHADDLYAHPRVLSAIADAFRDPEVDAVYGDLTYVQKADTARVVRYWRSAPFSRTRLAQGWMPPHPTLYLRRRIYEEYGKFDLSYRIAADYDFMLRVLSRIEGRVVYLPEVLVNMRVGGESNRSLRNIFRKSTEDLRALRSNRIGGFGALVLKNTSKLRQFLR